MRVRTNARWTADRVRKLRELLTLSQDALAEQLGVRGGTVRRWENGTHRPAGAGVLRKLDELASQVGA